MTRYFDEDGNELPGGLKRLFRDVMADAMLMADDDGCRCDQRDLVTDGLCQNCHTIRSVRKSLTSRHDKLEDEPELTASEQAELDGLSEWIGGLMDRAGLK